MSLIISINGIDFEPYHTNIGRIKRYSELQDPEKVRPYKETDYEYDDPKSFEEALSSAGVHHYKTLVERQEHVDLWA